MGELSAGMVVLLVGGGLVTLVFSAWILQASAAFAGVENLRYTRALLLVGALAAADGAAALAVHYLFLALGWDVGVRAGATPLLGVIVSLPVLFLLTAGILAWALSVRYVRALLVTFMQLVILAVFDAILGGLALVVLGFLQMTGPWW